MRLINTRRRPRSKSRLRRGGAAAVEFAVVAPVFFLMVIGFIEFGRALMVKQVLVNASRVGVREAITTPGTAASVAQEAVAFAQGAAVNGVSVLSSPDPGSAGAGTMLSVTVSVPFNQVSWLSSPWFLNGMTLTATSTMRKEGFN